MAVRGVGQSSRCGGGGLTKLKLTSQKHARLEISEPLKAVTKLPFTIPQVHQHQLASYNSGQIPKIGPSA